MVELDSVEIGMIFFAGTLVFIGIIIPVIISEENNPQKTKVLSTFISNSNTACSYKLGLNQDYDSPCPYHAGDNITVYQNGFGFWHIKTTGVVGN